jgi:DNA gyrase subunit A
MAKKNKNNLSLLDENGQPSIEANGVTLQDGDLSYDEHLRDQFLLYSASVITDRALPDVRDGLKPVHRRLLLAANDLHLSSRSNYMKCAKVVGEAMGNFHPHGDGALYDALVRMAQDFSMRLPLIDGQGSFGSIDGDSAAAMRYTECRLTPAAEAMLADLPTSKKEIAEILPNDTGRNFDGRLVEPQVLPARLPNLLINGGTGIAVGMASNILPHNPGEVLDLCIWRLQHPDATVEQVAKRLSGPDLPTGGTIVDNEELRACYLTGEGKVTILGKAHIEPIEGSRQQIVITELPYGVKKGGEKGFIEQLAKLYHDGKFPEFSDLIDVSTDEIRIEIPLKRGSDAHAVLARLYRDTKLSVNFGVQMRALVNGRPRILNLAELIDEFLDFRREIVINAAKKRMREIEERLHQLEAYMKAISAIDEVVALIKKAKNRETAKKGLKKLLGVDDQQAQWIVDMRLGNLTALDRYELEKEVKELRAEHKHLSKFIKTPSMVTDYLIDGFRELKKDFNTPRVSAFTDSDAAAAADPAAFSVPAEDCLLLVSRGGQALCGQGTLKRGANLALAAGDTLVCAQPARTDEERLIFTASGQCYRVRLADIELSSRRHKGTPLSQIVSMTAGDAVVGVHPADPGRDGAALFVYRSGTVKRTAWSEFASAHAGGILAAKPVDGDELLCVLDCPPSAELVMIASHGYGIRFHVEEHLRLMGRNANGNRGIKLPGGAEVRIAAAITDPSAQLVFTTTKGLAKRLALTDIPAQGRDGKGVQFLKNCERFGEPEFGTVVHKTDELWVISSDGRPAQAAVDKIPAVNRANTPKPWRDGAGICGMLTFNAGGH